MLFKFGMTNSQLVSTPLDRNLKLRPNSVTAYNEKPHILNYHLFIGEIETLFPSLHLPIFGKNYYKTI